MASTGQMRAMGLLQAKLMDNARLYAGLFEGSPSRQVRRRAERRLAKRQRAQAAAEVVRMRRGKRADPS